MPRPVPPHLIIAAFAAAALSTGCREIGGGRPLAELARLHDTRSIGPRVSIEREYRPCTGSTPAAAEALPPTLCGAEPPPASDRLLALASRVSAQVESDADAESLHAAGLIDLLWGGRSENSLNRSISYLSAAARLAERPGPALADLAAAYLVRADLTGSPRDLLEALESAERAVEAAPNDHAALYNLAYTLDRATLDLEATQTWTGISAADAEEGWTTEARARRDYLTVERRAPPEPSLVSDSLDAVRFAAEAPREARLLGWDILLARWGEALLEGDTASATANLRLASVLGAELVRLGGDPSLADAIAAIQHSVADSAATRSLARAHTAYGRGRAAFAEDLVPVARAEFRRGMAESHASGSLSAWLATYEAVALLVGGAPGPAEAELREIYEALNHARRPALAGQIAAAMAPAQLRTGQYENAAESARLAAAHFARARELESVASQLYIQADVEFGIGLAEDGYVSMYRALSMLRPYRRSVWRHNSLIILGTTAAGEGLTFAALRTLSEAVATSDLTGDPHRQIEARVYRARASATRGDSAAARKDIQRGRELLPEIQAEWSSQWMRTDLRLATAKLLAPVTPARAVAVLDSVLESPQTVGSELRHAEALMARAEARLTLGNPTGAETDLSRTANLLIGSANSTRNSAIRAALLNGGRALFDKLVLLDLAEGRPEQALQHLERGRVSFAPAGAVSADTDASLPLIPSGSRAVSYMLAGDTILAWVLSANQVAVTRSVVEREDLVRSIERTRTAMEYGGLTEVLHRDLAQLYAWLIEPIRSHLGTRGEELILVADGEIASVPFAALFDAEHRRYVVQDHPLRYSATLRDALRESSSGESRDLRQVFVADPGGEFGLPGFEPLPRSVEEVRAVASIYGNPEIPTRESITAYNVPGLLQRAEIFHFAGHAVFDAARPELSSLMFAPEESESAPTRFSAAALESLDLRHVRLIVLSACETLPSRSERSGGLAGFAGTLLQAGVGGVVGSLWRVDDYATAQLMIGFHRNYRVTGDGAAALRAAQLEMLASSEARLRSPAAWAAFRYAGN